MSQRIVLGLLKDEADIALSYKLALELRNHIVLVADNGVDCINIYQNEYQIRRSGFRKPLTEQNAKVVDQDDNQSHDIAEIEFVPTLFLTLSS